MSNSYVQTFFVNADAVGGASQVLISSVELYVKNKPNRDRNSSGLSNPGISVQICPATSSSVNVSGMQNAGRAQMTWDQIDASYDATVPTVFTFDPPIPVMSNEYYGIYVQMADSGYKLWEAVQGDRLVNTNTASSGPNGRYDGSLYAVTNDNTSRSLSNRDLKFGVSAARFSSNTSATISFIAENYEFLSINNKRGVFMNGERVFMDVSNKDLAVKVNADLPGSLQINASSTRILGNGTNFTTLAAGQFVVLSVASEANTYAIATVSSVTNSTVMFLKEPVPFSSNGFNGSYRVSPVADVADSTPYFDKTNEIVLYKSTANSSMRFVTGGLRGVTVTGPGAGYSNGNVIRVVSSGGRDALFSINTNGSGAITSLQVLDAGEKFSTVPTNIRIEVSPTDNTLKAGNPGANATIVVSPDQIGALIRGHISGSSANLVSVDNKSISEIWPIFQEINPADGTIAAEHTFSDGTPLGAGEYGFTTSKLGLLNDLTNYNAVLASKSNEAGANTGPSGRFNMTMTVNKGGSFLFETPVIESRYASVMTYENDINNDATNEHTNFGNARSKYIGKRISFDGGAVSEDLIVKVRANRPKGTDIKVYAKFHNSVDDEAFDDKLWTELQKTTQDVFTNPLDKAAQTEIEYTIPQFPEVDTRLTGLVSTSNNSTTVTGTGTAFANNLVGRLIKISSPLNPQNHQVVAVASVTNATSLVLTSPVVNNSIQESVVGNGLVIDTLKYSGTAFNNILNDNVARYHTMSNQAEIDGFDTFAIKVVLLSDNKYIVPSVNDIRMIGASA